MFNGSFVAIVTPFKKNLDIDYECLSDLIEFHIDSGTSGFVPAGTTGEAATLSESEHYSLVEYVIKRVKNRVPVIAGAGGNNTAAVIERINKLKKLGPDAFLVVTPYYNKPSQEGLYGHYKSIARETNVPIILYNVPGRTGVNLLPDTVARLSEIKQIVGIKEASGNIVQVSEILAKTPKKFCVLSGEDSLVLPILSIGGKGVISASANVIPADMADLIREFDSGRIKVAQSLHKKMLPVCQAMFIETNPVPVKTALAWMDKIEFAVRLPLAPMINSNKEKLRNILKENKVI